MDVGFFPGVCPASPRGGRAAVAMPPSITSYNIAHTPSPHIVSVTVSFPAPTVWAGNETSVHIYAYMDTVLDDVSFPAHCVCVSGDNALLPFLWGGCARLVTMVFGTWIWNLG